MTDTPDQQQSQNPVDAGTVVTAVPSDAGRTAGIIRLIQTGPDEMIGIDSNDAFVYRRTTLDKGTKFQRDEYTNIVGQLHRTDGPARESANGHRAWLVNGELTRTDGPAIERPNGYRAWYVNGKQLSADEFQARYGLTETS
jgi:hypothetical protein